MKKKPSLTKKVASVAAGTVLAASLYANAVYQPRNESALEHALDRELQALVNGEAEVVTSAEGFMVTERLPLAQPASSKLQGEIARLEAEIVSNKQAASRELASAMLAGEQSGSAYSYGDVVTVAQRTINVTTGGKKISFTIAGAQAGAFIGTLSAALSNPMTSQRVIAAIVSAVVSTTQGGTELASTATLQTIASSVAAITSNGGGNAGGFSETVIASTTVVSGSTTTSASTAPVATAATVTITSP